MPEESSAMCVRASLAAKKFLSRVLPSEGSIHHLDEACRPCSFFLKNRCVKGRDCSHCHFVHEYQSRPGKKNRERAKRKVDKEWTEYLGAHHGQDRPLWREYLAEEEARQGNSTRNEQAVLVDCESMAPPMAPMAPQFHDDEFLSFANASRQIPLEFVHGMGFGSQYYSWEGQYGKPSTQRF